MISDGRAHDIAAAPALPAPLHLLQTGMADDWDRRLTVLGAPAFAILGEPVTLTLRVDDLGAAPDAPFVPLEVSVDGAPPQLFEVETGTVEDRDIGQVLAACDMPNIGEGRDVIHAMPVNFALDQNPSLNDPRGQIGHLLSVDMHLLTVDAVHLQNLIMAVRRCDLELAGVVSSAYVSAVSALVEDEQELGAACVDIGGGSTSISIFLKKHLIYADSVRIGGDHVTNDLSQGLRLSKPDAERLKSIHGGVLATSMDDRDIIDLNSKTGDWDHDRRQITRSEVIGIMRPRLEEILEVVHHKLMAARFDTLPSQRIVLTGGGSQIPGLEGLASRILGQQVRLGRPLRIHGLPQAATGPDFSAAVGLALYAAHPQDECWDFELPQPRIGEKPMRRAMQWIRENW